MYDELVKALRELSGWDIMDYEDGCGYANGIIKQAADAIEELQKAVNFHKFNSEFWEDKYNSLVDEKWIPVTERLPEIRKVVLITDGVDVGTGWVNQGWWNTPFADIQRDTVTHWMPLPEPPKEE